MIPNARAIDKTELRFTWLRDNFVRPPVVVDHVVRHYGRTDILALVGSVLFHYKSRTDVLLFMLPLLRYLEEARLSHGAGPSYHVCTLSYVAQRSPPVNKLLGL